MTHIHDMVIIGAGLSGVGAACRYREAFPDKDLAVVEARDAIGGTWDLFRYPGIRSDSDMLTLGYDFRPWVGDKILADGPSIRKYVQETADEYDVTRMVQFGHKVTKADFSTDENLWTLTLETKKTGKTKVIKTRFITSCAGYYKYEEGYTPSFEGREDFKGDILHPQHWPENYDYVGKHVTVIGSGATAVTLVPEMAKTAGHVVMLQRSPTYIASIPSKDAIGNFMRKVLPARMAFTLNKKKNMSLHSFMYKRARKNPEKAREWFRTKTLEALGKDYPVDVHFKPSYNPWDQRVCMVPDADLFDAINDARASIMTDQIDRFTEDGIQLASGVAIKTDVIVTATGLNVVFVGGINASVDGAAIDIPNTFGYKGLMFSGVPNMISVFGYTNASWTLRSELISRYMIRLVKHMDDNGYQSVTPIAPEGMPQNPWIDFQAGYLMRVIDDLPKQGDRMPWLNVQDYKHDIAHLIKAPIADDALVFSGKPALQEAAE